MYQYTVYRAKKDKTGVAVSFSISDNGCFLIFAKQQPTDNDSFAWVKKGEKSDPKRNATIHLGLADIGAMLTVLNGIEPQLELYHEFPKNEANKIVSIISLSQYSKDIKNKKGENVTLRGMALNLSRSGEKFGLILSLADVEIYRVLFAEAVLNLTHVTFEKKT